MKSDYPYSALAFSIAASFMLMSTSHGIVPVTPIPNAGQLLQQQLSAPPAPQAPVEIKSLSALTSDADSSLQIAVTSIIIEGNRQFSTDTLYPLIADAQNQNLSLAGLQTLAQRITDFYRSNGYPYSQAYLPEQTLSDGVVRIAVLEAVYDTTQINNQSRTQDWLIDATVAPLQTGAHIEQQQLQQQLKLLNRLNGVITRNVLAPGSLTGSSQLNIDVQDTALLTGYIGADNFGSEYTDEARFSAGVAMNNLAGLGDQLSVEGLTTGSGLNYGKVGYEFTFTGMGTQAGASYSYLDYELGDAIERLGAEGKAAQTSVWLSQPVLLSNTSELSASLRYDHKQLEDDINLSQFFKRRDIDLITARLDGSQYDQRFGGGLTQYGVSSSYGQVDFKDDNAQAIDAQTANTQGDFYRIGANLSRLQNLGSKGTQGYASIYGQYSPYNLDSAEQYIGGGPFNVRGYESNQLAGSSGYYATLELRQDLINNINNKVGAKVFVDTADITLNAKKWAGVTGSNTGRLSSAGVGANWNSALGIQASAEVGFPIGSTPEQLQERDDAQYWLSVRKTF
jgi:hemolysin activation/secretion protein